MTTLGARMMEIDEGKVAIEAAIGSQVLQQHGAAHAGLAFSIGDSAAGYAALTVLPPDQEVVTAEIKVNFLAPARGDMLRATGHVIKPGRRLVIVTAEVHAIAGDQETLIALMQGTMVPVAP
ncbi:PaaI family thioesterase [Thalassococcus sp. S3]|uniref:PaaI family thioesterase n=1 Tax=Thalassococcus sp. S3 TaxID=2017482 RepID=UPI0020C3AD4A|nr:PaaI family thioesterase [Thalassococcus sp. S3]